MSMVAVHGPNTWGSMGASGGGGMVVTNTGGTVTADPTNGRRFTFAGAGDRAAADYDWSFSGGAAVAAQPNLKTGTVNFTDDGPKVITLTLGSSGGTTPAPGTYTFNVVATAGGGPRAEAPTEPPPDTVYDESAYAAFILADHSINEVKDFLGHYALTAEDWNNLVTEESEGANRITLLDWLNTHLA